MVVVVPFEIGGCAHGGGAAPSLPRSPAVCSVEAIWVLALGVHCANRLDLHYLSAKRDEMDLRVMATVHDPSPDSCSEEVGWVASVECGTEEEHLAVWAARVLDHAIHLREAEACLCLDWAPLAFLCHGPCSEEVG